MLSDRTAFIMPSLTGLFISCSVFYYKHDTLQGVEGKLLLTKE